MKGEAEATGLVSAWRAGEAGDYQVLQGMGKRECITGTKRNWTSL